jgi:ribosomal-protein-alanine N-acetyltransferase
MKEGDAEALAAVLRACPEAAPWAPEPGQGRAVFVAEDEGEVAGFAVWQLLPEGEAELLNLAVHPRARRRGIGRALVEAAGARRAWLEVRASNEGAIRFYQALGFTVCGVRRRYYRDPEEDAILMQRESQGENPPGGGSLLRRPAGRR